MVENPVKTRENPFVYTQNASKRSLNLKKLLVSLGFMNQDEYISTYLVKQRLEFLHFVLGIFVSGLLIHLAFIWVYLYFTLWPPLWAFVPLTFSFGLFQHYFLNWIPKKAR